MSAADRAAAIGLDEPLAVSDLDDSEVEAWLHRLLSEPDISEIEASIRSWRELLGTWWALADRVGRVLIALGHAWASGEISILEEHVISERLRRALLRCAEDYAPLVRAPRALLATAAGEDHDLGLVLCELVLREAGWTVLWCGRRSPIDSLDAYVRTGGIQLVALSASSYATDTVSLRRELETLVEACELGGCGLVVGGAGLWPEPPPRGVTRFHTFAEMVAWLADRGEVGPTVGGPPTSS